MDVRYQLATLNYLRSSFTQKINNQQVKLVSVTRFTLHPIQDNYHFSVLFYFLLKTIRKQTVL